MPSLPFTIENPLPSSSEAPVVGERAWVRASIRHLTPGTRTRHRGKLRDHLDILRRLGRAALKDGNDGLVDVFDNMCDELLHLRLRRRLDTTRQVIISGIERSKQKRIEARWRERSVVIRP